MRRPGSPALIDFESTVFGLALHLLRQELEPLAGLAAGIEQLSQPPRVGF